MSVRRTSTKTAVLELLREHAKPVGAYQIIALLSERRGTIAPTTVYRAVAALIREGRAHRVESKNAFVACQCPADCAMEVGHTVLSICDDCGKVAEYQDAALRNSLAALAERSGFAASRHVIEVHGRCADCVGGDLQ
ncbi:MAG: transcriptional repressor [Neomegalonema sp.]|nr:transcriptional repressor [Neomegalonema sp.]